MGNFIFVCSDLAVECMQPSRFKEPLEYLWWNFRENDKVLNVDF